MTTLTRIRLRRDTASAWTLANTVLTAGEPAYVTDTGQFKIGNGTDPWTALPFRDSSDNSSGDAANIDGYASHVTNFGSPILEDWGPALTALWTDILAGTAPTDVYFGRRLDGMTFNRAVRTPVNWTAGSANSRAEHLVLRGGGMGSGLILSCPSLVTDAGAGFGHGTTPNWLFGSLDYVEMRGLDIQGQLTYPTARVCSLTNIALTGLPTIDGVTVVAGDRVLLMGQTDPKTNGLYRAAAGAWSRAPELDSTADFNAWHAGALVHVTAGTTNTNTTWQVQTVSPFTLGGVDMFWTSAGSATEGSSIMDGWRILAFNQIRQCLLDGVQFQDIAARGVDSGILTGDQTSWRAVSLGFRGTAVATVPGVAGGNPGLVRATNVINWLSDDIQHTDFTVFDNHASVYKTSTQSVANGLVFVDPNTTGTTGVPYSGHVVHVRGLRVDEGVRNSIRVLSPSGRRWHTVTVEDMSLNGPSAGNGTTYVGVYAEKVNDLDVLNTICGLVNDFSRVALDLSDVSYTKVKNLNSTKSPGYVAGSTRPAATTPAPSNLRLTERPGEGTLSAGTYFYQVETNTGYGNSLPNAEVSLAVGANAAILVEWDAVPTSGSYAVPQSYLVFGRVTGGTKQKLIQTIDGSGVLSFLDTGAITPAGALDTVDHSTSISTNAGWSTIRADNSCGLIEIEHSASMNSGTVFDADGNPATDLSLIACPVRMLDGEIQRLVGGPLSTRPASAHLLTGTRRTRIEAGFNEDQEVSGGLWIDPSTRADVSTWLFTLDAQAMVGVIADGDPITDYVTPEGLHVIQMAGANAPIFRATGLNGKPAIDFGNDALAGLTCDFGRAVSYPITFEMVFKRIAAPGLVGGTLYPQGTLLDGLLPSSGARLDVTAGLSTNGPPGGHLRVFAGTTITSTGSTDVAGTENAHVLLFRVLSPSPCRLASDGVEVLNASAGTARTTQSGVTIGSQQGGSNRFRGLIPVLRAFEGQLQP